MPIDAKRFRAKARMVPPTPENAGATRNGARVKRILPMEETMGYRGAWTQGGIEPLIDELLSDPIVVAVMRRDGLRPEDVRAALHECRRRRETGLLWSGLGNRDSLTQFVRMLARIGLDSEGSPLRPSTRDDLYATCLRCENREPCAQWLDSGKAVEGYQDFCPNATLFDRLLRVSRWRRA